MPRSTRPKPPLDRAGLQDIALSYVARYATTRAKLEAYLRRKLRERGWDGEGEAPVEAISARFVEDRYVDDAAYARGKAASLLRRGYGARRVGQALHAAGVGEEVREDALPGEGRQRDAALALARKRGFGPFGAERLDSARRQKQLAAMVRAGHSFEQARTLVDAPDIAAAEEWAAEASGDDRCE